MSIRCKLGFHAYLHCSGKCERCGQKHDSRKGGIIGPRDNALHVGGGIYVKPDMVGNMRPIGPPPAPRPRIRRVEQ